MRFSTEDILQPFHTIWLPADIQAAMLRLDRIHSIVSGNKWFKLKYNLEAAAGRPIVTFGGAYSNHIVATAAACGMAGIPCTGIIRGEEPAVLSHTLQLAASLGMELVFVSREAYRLKDASAFPDAYVIPEGGHNALGAKGCSEILSLAETAGFSHIICAVGTGTTLAGLVNAVSDDDRQIIGISVLKGAASLDEETRALLVHPDAADVPQNDVDANKGDVDVQQNDVNAHKGDVDVQQNDVNAHKGDLDAQQDHADAQQTGENGNRGSGPANKSSNWAILHQFHEGGYGKISDRLIATMNDFYRQTGIPTDQVYTGKMVLAVQQLLEQSYFPPNSRLLLIHSGGLQGNDSLPPGVLCY